MTRSHLTQQLQNYFDITDVRVRQQPYTLDAQLLNAVALQLEEHELRVNRELAGRYLSSCPLQLDNQGVYYRVQVPNSMPLTLDANGKLQPPANVVGQRNSDLTPLTPFDDRLPVPSAVSSGAAVRMASPVLATLTSTWVDQLSPGVLPIPNRLSFWADGLGETASGLTVVIEGETWPRSLWPGQRQTVSESFLITQEGLSRSSHIWYSVSSLRVYAIPPGGRVVVYAIEMNLPAVPDPARPFMTWDDREFLYNRYWQVENGLLKEGYYVSPEAGFPDLPLVSDMTVPDSLQDVAVEPSTWGAFAVDANANLYYFDRREPAPDSLSASALSAEPFYGLAVAQDDDSSALRQVVLTAQPYAQAGQEVSHRYSVAMPDGSLWQYYFNTVLNSWSLKPWDSAFWIGGAPPEQVRFPLTVAGTHVFKLETRAPDGSIRYDAQPFLNRMFSPLATFALPLGQANGLGFDYAQQLWVWDGTFLQPLALTYQGYAWDPGSRSLFLTQLFDSIWLS